MAGRRAWLIPLVVGVAVYQSTVTYDAETMARTVASGHPFAAVVGCWNTQQSAIGLARTVLGPAAGCEQRAACAVCTLPH